MRSFWLANRHLIIAGAISLGCFAFAFLSAPLESLVMLSGQAVAFGAYKYFKD